MRFGLASPICASRQLVPACQTPVPCSGNVHNPTNISDFRVRAQVQNTVSIYAKFGRFRFKSSRIAPLDGPRGAKSPPPCKMTHIFPGIVVRYLAARMRTVRRKDCRPPRRTCQARICRETPCCRPAPPHAPHISSCSCRKQGVNSTLPRCDSRRNTCQQIPFVAD
jgi:hypothetical protein